MPFSFKKRNKRREIPRDVILRALEEVSKGGKIKTTAIKYDIPRSNLQRYIKQGGVVKDISSKFISSQIFMKDEEEKISEYLVTLFKLNHGMSKLKARELVYEYATAINKKIPDNWTEKKLASNDWLRGFFKRQPHLSIRTPEATSLSRATSFNKKNVRDFFENLKTVYERHCFGPESIYNIDETGLSTVQRTQKVIALRGTKQVGQVTSAERGTLVTVCCGINALGNSIPPFFIFPRVNFKTYMLNDAPVGSDGAAHPSGWMTAPCFLKYIHHFAKHAKPTPSSPVLLLLDNHESHISVPVLDFCKESGIVLMTFPPHCSHKLQPLDLTVYGPLKTYYNTVVTDWMVSNPGKTVTIYEIPKLAAKAIPLAFKLQNIQTGFKKPGIWPFNSNIFSDEDFVCSSITDRCLPEENNVATEKWILEQPIMEQPSTEENLSLEDRTSSNVEATGPSQLESLSKNQTRGTVNVTPDLVRPFPKAGPRKLDGMKRKKGKTRILTDTPEKRIIEMEEKERKRKDKIKELNKNRKCSRNEKSTKISSDDEIKNASVSDVDLVEIDSSEEDFDVDDVIVMDRKFQINDFVLVKFDTKKTVYHYVGIVEEVNHSMATVKFMRASKIRNTFMFPDIEDVASVPLEDIKTKLPTPTTWIKRGSLKYKFDKPLWVIPNLR
ncbi:uncharacterized protein LOC136074128 [Hydra vulgaris]|uniref:Uncharacterized protein LOC136074128 n=1 Tax=Hydra vulgaris TaxID=6087 RepID=A0ABM4B139_HYDVU